MYIETHRETQPPRIRTPRPTERTDRTNRSPWITPVPAAHPEAEVYERRARASRAAAFRQVFGGLARGATSSLATIGKAVRRARLTAKARRQLGRLDDRLLADIGIERQDIPVVVDGLLASSERRGPAGTRRRPRPTALARTGSFLDRSIVGPIRRWHQARVTYRALEALDDRLLRDIGISRADIEAVAYGDWRPNAQRTAAEHHRESEPSYGPAPGQEQSELRKAA